jgi:Na+-driven multidrug efflux pump
VTDAEPESSITQGGLARPLFTLAWPIVVTQLLQVAYNLADTLWLGRYSAAAVGALSLAFLIIFLLLSVGGGFTVAGSTLVAQYTGAGGEGSAGKAAGQTLSFVTAPAVVLGALGFVVTGSLLALLPADPDTAREVVPLAADYMRVFFVGTPFLFGFFVLSALMRGHGNTRTPMRVMAVPVALNIVLDPVLIFGARGSGTRRREGRARDARLPGRRDGHRPVRAVRPRGRSRGPALPPPPRSRDDPEDRRHRRPLGAGAVHVGAGDAHADRDGRHVRPAVVAAYGLGNRLISLVFLPAMGLGRVATVYVLAFVLGWGVFGLWVGMATGNVLGAIAAAAWFTRGTWKEAIVDEGTEERVEEVKRTRERRGTNRRRRPGGTDRARKKTVMPPDGVDGGEGP